MGLRCSILCIFCVPIGLKLSFCRSASPVLWNVRALQNWNCLFSQTTDDTRSQGVCRNKFCWNILHLCSTSSEYFTKREWGTKIVTCPRWHTEQVAELGLEPRFSGNCHNDITQLSVMIIFVWAGLANMFSFSRQRLWWVREEKRIDFRCSPSPL